jgi:Tfp pilus assembly PilM family ATPase
MSSKTEKSAKKKKPSLSFEKLIDFFTQQPSPSAAFHLTSSYISGLNVSAKERKVKQHFIYPLEEEMIVPSFQKKNIQNASILKDKLKNGIKKLRLSEHRAAVLIPELSQKTFVFTADSLPSSQKEREQIVRFRVKRQMPMLPDDSRITFDVIPIDKKARVVVTLARTSVVKEYEDLFDQLKLKVRTVGYPSLGLSNLFQNEEEQDLILINIEEDSFSLMALTRSVISLYRQKPFAFDIQDKESIPFIVENIAQEIETTANFVEDKEKRIVNSLFVRIGLLEGEDKIFSLLEEKLRLPVHPIESFLKFSHSRDLKRMLSPLIGQIT